jgi:hypothetical protein
VTVTRGLGAQLESLPTRPGRRLLRLRLPRLAGSPDARV